MRNIINIFTIVLILSWTSCLDKIDFEVPADLTDSIVIQGRLEKGNPSTVVVNVSQVFDFSAASRTPIKAREPKIMDDQGNELLLRELATGVYVGEIGPNDAIKVEEGNQFKIALGTFDGRNYESNFETLYSTPEPESITISQKEIDVLVDGENQKDQRLVFSINTPVITASGNVGLLWEMERVFSVNDSPQSPLIEKKTCYITETVGVDKVTLAKRDDIVGGRVDNFPLFESPFDFKFALGYYFVVRQFSLSQSAFDYFTAVGDLLERTGNMFESPAGKVPTNLYNVNDPNDEVYGFFYVTEAKLIRLGVTPEQGGSPRETCPPTVPSQSGECPVLICCDCLAIDRSTTVKPPYWEF